MYCYGLASASYSAAAQTTKRPIMSDQFKTIFNKAKLNFAILASILVLAIVGKLTNPEFTNSIFLMADQLVSELILLFVAITLGAFIPNFKLVVLGFASIANLYRHYREFSL